MYRRCALRPQAVRVRRSESTTPAPARASQPATPSGPAELGIPQFSPVELEQYQGRRALAKHILDYKRSVGPYPIETDEQFEDASERESAEDMLYLINNGDVNPAVLRRQFSKEVKNMAAQSPEDKVQLRRTVADSVEESTWALHDQRATESMLKESSYELETILAGKDEGLLFGSLKQSLVLAKLEHLFDTSPLFKDLTWDQKLNIAKAFDLSLGVGSLEWTWPSPPPSHTWVELPVYTPPPAAGGGDH